MKQLIDDAVHPDCAMYLRTVDRENRATEQANATLRLLRALRVAVSLDETLSGWYILRNAYNYIAGDTKPFQQSRRWHGRLSQKVQYHNLKYRKR